MTMPARCLEFRVSSSNDNNVLARAKSTSCTYGLSEAAQIAAPRPREPRSSTPIQKQQAICGDKLLALVRDVQVHTFSGRTSWKSVQCDPRWSMYTYNQLRDAVRRHVKSTSNSKKTNIGAATEATMIVPTMLCTPLATYSINEAAEQVPQMSMRAPQGQIQGQVLLDLIRDVQHFTNGRRHHWKELQEKIPRWAVYTYHQLKGAYKRSLHHQKSKT